jgi:methyltransferase
MDMRFDKDLEGQLEKQNYDVVGIAIPFTTSINTCNTILRTVHTHAPEIVKIIGGHYPSTSLKQIDLHYVDYAVLGEATQTMQELLGAIERGENPEKIPGIAIVHHGIAQYTEKRKFDDLDQAPFPARHLLKQHHRQYFHAHYQPITLMRFSVGCPYDCSFCILWKMTNRRYFTRSISSVIEELLSIDNQNIYVVDDEAFIQVARMFHLADEIVTTRLKKKFHMYVRSDTVVNNPALFAKWAEAGLDSVLVGMESIFGSELAEYNKKIDLCIARECVNILHEHNIEIRANFIIKPDYTLDKFKRLRETINELNIDRPTFAVLTPFIGTETYIQMKDDLISDRPEFYDCFHTVTKTTLDLKTFYKEFSDLFRAAQQRDADENSKIFYGGKGNAFGGFVDKIQNAYMQY